MILKTVEDYSKLEGVIKTYNLENNKENIIEAVSTDTRENLRNLVFIALRGEKFDGHDYLPLAIKKGAKLLIIDSEADSKLNSNGKLFSQDEFKQVAILVFANTVDALINIAREKRRIWNKDVITITGSVGKTSTRNCVEKCLRSKFNTRRTLKNLNNPIGVSKTLLTLENEDLAILELGMDRQGEILQSSRACEANLAIITNIGYSHIERLGSREAIANAKFEIIEHLASGASLILNLDDKILLSHFLEFSSSYLQEHNISRLVLCAKNDVVLDERIREKVADLSSSEIYHYSYECVDQDIENRTFLRIKKNIYNELGRAENSRRAFLSLNDEDGDCENKVDEMNAKVVEFNLPLMAMHHIKNAAIAFACADLYGIDKNEIELALQERENEGDRERLEKLADNYIFHDYYNASLESMRASFMSASLICKDLDSRIGILACVNELGDYAPEIHREIGRSLSELFKVKLENLYLLGPFAKEMAEAYYAEVEDVFEHSNLEMFVENHTFKDREELWHKLKDDLFGTGKIKENNYFFLLKGSRGYKLELIADKIKYEILQCERLLK